jgi:hypothetical protein
MSIPSVGQCLNGMVERSKRDNINGDRRQIVPRTEDNDTMPKGARKLDKAHLSGRG